MARIIATLAVWLAASMHVHADEMADAALELCEKVKACSLAQIDQEDLTPEIEAMMKPMLDGMCANMQSRVASVNTSHPMYDVSLSCMRSMSALTCDQLMNENQVVTPECEEYEAEARKYGDEAP